MSKLLFQTTLDTGFLFMKSHCDVQVYDDHMEQQRYAGKKKKMEFSQSYEDVLHVKLYHDSELVPGTFIELTSKTPQPIVRRYIYQTPRVMPYGIKVDGQALSDLVWHLCEAMSSYHEQTPETFPSCGDPMLDRQMKPLLSRGLARHIFTVPGLTLYCMAEAAYTAFPHGALDESGTKCVGLELVQAEFEKLMRAPSLNTFRQIDSEFTRDRKKFTNIPANLNLRTVLMLKLQRDLKPTLDYELEQALMASPPK